MRYIIAELRSISSGKPVRFVVKSSENPHGGKKGIEGLKN